MPISFCFYPNQIEIELGGRASSSVSESSIRPGGTSTLASDKRPLLGGPGGDLSHSLGTAASSSNSLMAAVASIARKAATRQAAGGGFHSGGTGFGAVSASRVPLKPDDQKKNTFDVGNEDDDEVDEDRASRKALMEGVQTTGLSPPHPLNSDGGRNGNDSVDHNDGDEESGCLLKTPRNTGGGAGGKRGGHSD